MLERFRRRPVGTGAGLHTVALAITVAIIGAFAAGAGADTLPKRWAATWATANKIENPFFDAARPAPIANDTTLRQIVRISKGGSHFRVWLTNELGSEPLNVGAANLALRDAGSAIVGSGRTLTFDGQTSVTIGAGSRVVSDPVALRAPDHADLAISIHLPEDLTGSASAVTYHPRALQTNYELTGAGDQTGVPELVGPTEIYVWAYLAAVDVATTGPIAVIAAFGDSLTDGDQVAADEPIDLNARYPNFLSTLFLERENPGRGQRVGQIGSVVNLGISGNQVTSPLLGDAGVARFERDVLGLSGVSHVIIWEGINDIGLPPLFMAPYVSAETIQNGLQQMAEEARSAGLTVIGCTITPAGGFALPTYGSATAEEIRQAVNEWIRNSDAFDVVVDLDALVRDPITPEMLRSDITVDGLHFTSAGYAMIAEAIFAKLRRGKGRHPL